MAKLFTCKNVNQNLEKFKLKDITFNLDGGLILGIYGDEGSGKTTLLKTLMGTLDCTDSKDIRIESKSLIRKPQEYKENIAFVLNETPFIKNNSALLNGRLFGRFYKDFDLKKYEELLEEYGVTDFSETEKTRKQKLKNYAALKNLKDSKMIKQQLAFAMSYQPKLYFMDEPVVTLEDDFKDEFLSAVKKLVEDGKHSIIYASRSREELGSLADYVLWLKEKDGVSTVYFYGTTKEFEKLAEKEEVKENA